MAISHIDADQRAYGPPNNSAPGNPDRYFINPIGIQSLILSAAELGPAAVLASENLDAFSAHAILRPFARCANRVSFPLVQGMGFVTGVYTGLQLVIQSSVFFRTVVAVGFPRNGIFKYRITLEDGKNWLLYAKPTDGQDPQLSLISNCKLQGPRSWSGVIQVAKNNDGDSGEAIYDGSAGVYAISAEVSGSTTGTTGTYQLRWSKAGGVPEDATKLLMYALPHHVQSFAGPTAHHMEPLRLQTTTKGVATAVVADSWTLVERNLPTDIGFAPWNPSRRTVTDISTAASKVIQDAANAEIRQDMDAQTNLDSMYFSGKALSKFATLLYTIHDFQPQPDSAQEGLTRLKAAFARFVDNNQQYSLAYETAWKGVVSTGSYVTGRSDQDFGNTYYNDHHFHYGGYLLPRHDNSEVSSKKWEAGYFIHTAAIIGYLDPGWLASNTDWVNMLVRDAANPSTEDTYFPFSRAFDWYHGHSFAKGLFESADSKDEESSSEDAFFSYAVKMWGQVTGDCSMEARGNLILAIQARTLKSYFLMESDNHIHPPNFIGNKAVGIVSDLAKKKKSLGIAFAPDFSQS